MANVCYYKIKVIGTQAAAYFVYGAMPIYDDKSLISVNGSKMKCTLIFEGDCKWSVDYGTTDSFPNSPNLQDVSDQRAEKLGEDYWDVSLRAKSKALKCEIQALSWSGESGFNAFQWYKNGECMKERRVAYGDEGQVNFDWDTLEFVGHKGECDDSVQPGADGKEMDAVMDLLNASLGGKKDSKANTSQPKSGVNWTYQSVQPGADGKKMEEVMGLLNASLDGKMGSKAKISLPKSVVNWTFQNAQRTGKHGWTIAVPDGFSVEKDGDAIVMFSSESMNVSISINEPSGTEWGGSADMMLHHDAARSAMVCAILGMGVLNYAANTPNIPNLPDGLISSFYSDIKSFPVAVKGSAAFVHAKGHPQNGVNYLITMLLENSRQPLRVDAGPLSKKDYDLLTSSVKRWLETIQLKKPLSGIKPCYFSSLGDIQMGKYTKLNKAIRQATTDYGSVILCGRDALQHCIDSGIQHVDVRKEVKSFLNQAMEVLAYYYTEADGFVERLVSGKADEKVRIAVIKKLLKEMPERITKFDTDEGTVSISVPESIRQIEKKWKTIQEDARKQQNEEKKKLQEEEKARKRLQEEARKLLQKEEKKKLQEEEKARKRLQEEEEKKLQEEEEARKHLQQEELEKSLRLVKEEHDRLDQEAKKKYEAVEARCRQEISAAQVAISSSEQLLNSLSFFSFSKKKAERSRILEQEEIVAAKKRELESARARYDRELQENEKSAREKEADIRRGHPPGEDEFCGL